MSNMQLGNTTSAFLATKYEIPLGLMNHEITRQVQEIDDAVSSMLLRVEELHKRIGDIVEEQFSDSNIIQLTEINPTNITESSSVPQEHVGDLAKDTSKNIFLKEARLLFKEHVGGVLEDTKKNLLHGSALSKLSTTLSFPGKTIEGVSIFWDTLIQKHPALNVLDKVVIKPIAIALYTQILPVLAIVKACEFVGKSVQEVSKTGKWSSIKNVASQMAKSTIKHFERVFGQSTQVMLFDALNVLKVDDSKKETLKSIIRSSDTFLDDFSTNPKIASSIVAGVAVAFSKGEGSQNILKQSVLDVLSGEHKDAKVIDIGKLLQEGVTSKFQLELKNVFKSNLLEVPQSFKSIIDAISNSEKITGEKKYELIEAVSQYVVQKTIGKNQNQSASVPENPKVVESAQEKVGGSEKWANKMPDKKSVLKAPKKNPKKKNWEEELKANKAAGKNAVRETYI